MGGGASFSPDYLASRARFRSSALALGCDLEEHAIGHDAPDGSELTVDVALLGARRPSRVVVVSSGLHGVEGFFGAAVQAAMLEDELGGWAPPSGLRVVMIHALNPYGYAWLRRVNEDNIDLNRNFLRKDEAYSGAPDKYADLDALLNPQTPPSGFEPFLPLALYNIARHGLPALKNAVAGGQYEYPRGVFFGGSRASRTVEIVDENLPTWIGEAEHVLHVDFHTGLGKSATYKLLVDHEAGSERVGWLAERFGADAVQPWAPGGVSYEIRGGMGTWCKARFPNTTYDVLAAEFGTVSVLKVIAALRAENRAHHYGAADAPSTVRAKQALREVFAPSDPRWRDKVVERGVRVVQQAIDTLS
jgi:hypothetical protein